MEEPFKYEPTSGWKAFSKLDELNEAISQYLKKSEWKYYSFTSNTSTWDSDSKARNYLNLLYEDDRIAGLEIAVTNDGSSNYKVLIDIQIYLKDKHNLNETKCYQANGE